MKHVKIILSVLLTVTIITISFIGQYQLLIQDIENTAKSKEAQINRYVDLCVGFVDMMTLYSNDYFERGIGNDADLYSMLQYDPETNTYNLDAIQGTKYQNISGNLTGENGIPTEDIYRSEVNLALYLNKEFNSVYNKIPEAAWIYYTSENNFINLYPWTVSKDFAFDEALKKEQFYTCVIPENNPLRIAAWSEVYLDHAGQGLMVSLSSPVYFDDTFMGAISIDLTNKQMSEIIHSSYETYIIDEADSIIATTVDITFGDEVLKLDSIFKGQEDEITNLKSVENRQMTVVDNFYVYSTSFTNAPWKMYIRVPIYSVIGKAMLATIPLFIICILLLDAFWEVEKRKKVEKKLSLSITELNSYQTLLENAAKYDFLTSTVNRRGLMDIYEKNFEDESLKNQSIVFIMGDVDDFKNLNDTYGHCAGDLVLKQVAQIMQEKVGKHDVVCRWGGEEFVILLIGKTYEEALNLAEVIRVEIAAAEIPWTHSMQIKATMTFGVAEHIKNEDITIGISKADAAMYSGKQQGKNVVVGTRL